MTRRHVAEDLVVLVDHVGVPEQRRRGLRSRPRGARGRAHLLGLVQVGGVFGAGDRRRSRSTELIGCVEHERLHVREPRGLGRLCRRRRGEHPGAGWLRGDTECRGDGSVAPVTEPTHDQLARSRRPDGNPGQSRLLRNLCQRDVQVVVVRRHQRRGERREVVGEGRVRGGRDRGSRRGAPDRLQRRAVRRIAAADRHHRVVLGRLHVGHVEISLRLELRRRQRGRAHGVDRDDVPVQRRLRRQLRLAVPHT